MMKKIFALVLLLVLGKLSFSQGYPLQQNLGNDSTIVVSKGALQSRLVPIVVSDTAAANAQRIKTYPGAQLYTTNGNFYIRNSNATKWVLVSSGSSGPVNIYNSDGTLTGNRTLTGAGYSLTFNQLSKLLFNADSTTINTDQATILNNGVSTLSVKGATGRLFLVDTTAPADERIYELKSSNGEFFISILNDAQTSNDSAFLITSASRVGINTLNPDSTLKVGGGVNIVGGLRVGNLPTSPGTKALRIDANGRLSVADTTAGSGTVVSVATNDGTGIKGGTITTSGTLYIDTTIISTVASVSGGLAGKLNISDTSNMLKDYFNKVGYGLSRSTQTILTDSATLSAYYLRRKDSLTVTNPLGYVTQKILADTAAAIRSSDLGGTVTSVATNNGTGITGGTITTSGTLAIDTLLISTRAWRQKGIDSVAALVGSGYVPYMGATQNLDLGQFGLKTKYVEFDTSSQAVTDRRLQWSNDEGTLQFGMTNGATITQRIGLEQFARVKNVQGSQINKGQAVYIYGASGDRASVKLADNRADSTSSKTLGVAAEDIPINDVGLVGTFGQVGNLNLSTFSPGDILYLDSIPGQLTATKPQAPYHLVFIGVVERANSGNGLLFVNPQNGYELEELHNVRITSPVPNKAILLYDSVARLWVDTTVAASGIAVTQVNTNSATGITGGPITTTGTISADTLLLSTRAWRQKGIDSVAALINSNVSGTTNYVSKFTGTNTIGNSSIFDNGSNVGIGTASPASTPGYRTLSLNGTSGSILDFKTNGTSRYQIYGDATRLAIENLTGPGGIYLNQSNGYVGIATTGPDSLLTVNGSTHLKNAVRMSGLPQAPGTKALRIDASGTISYADTLIDAGGTVTSVATNNGTGITGGTITTTGTLAIDTLLISTRAWRQKGVDSVAGLLSGYVPTSRTLTINGTSYDLSANRSWSVGTVTSVATNTGTGITGGTITSSGTIAADTLLLSTRAWRQKGIDSVAALISSNISGTTNYIPKFTSSSAIGNSVIYDNGGSIGINITDASFPLEVSSNAGGSSIKIRGRATANSGTLRFYSNDNATQIAKFEASDNAVEIGAITNVPLVFVQNASEQMRLTSTGLGIGTSSPAYKLHVSGTGGTMSTLTNVISRFNATTNTNGEGSGIALTAIATKETGVILGAEHTSGSNGDFVVKIYNGGADYPERLRLTASGNLGLGVTPSAWGGNARVLEGANGSALTFNSAAPETAITSNAYYNGSNWIYKTSDEASRYSVNGYNGSHTWEVAASGTAGNAISFTQAMTLDASGRLGIGSTNPGANLEIVGGAGGTDWVRLIRTGVIEWAINANGGDFNLVNNTASANRFMVTQGGNVGIGTTSPTSISGYGVVSLNGTTGSLFNGMSNGTSASYFGTDAVSTFVYELRNAFLGFGTNNTERMRITSGGNVGINTSNPQVLLHIVKSSNPRLDISTTDSYSTAKTVYITQAGTYGVVESYDYSASTGLPLSLNPSGGNVGIGTTSPTYKLDVSGNFKSLVNNEALRLQSVDANGNYITFHNGSGAYGYIGSNYHLSSPSGSASDLGVRSENNLIFLSGGASERMRITSGGNTEIRSGNILNIYRTDNTRALQLYTTSNECVIDSWEASSEPLMIRSNGSGGRIVFHTNAAERMRITSGGELLINTTSDAGDYKLQVNGNVYQTGNLHISKTDAAANLQIRMQQANRQYWDFLTDQNESLTLKPQNSTTGEVPAFRVQNSSGTNQFSINTNTSAAEFAGTIKTAAPSGGTAVPWKLGSVVSTSGLTLNTGKYVEVEIDGVAYKLALIN